MLSDRRLYFKEGIHFEDMEWTPRVLLQARRVTSVSLMVYDYYVRVGSENSIKVNVRVIAATNHNLEKESLENRFRPDLFYRLNALHIEVPPLRERVNDIEPLINHFIGIFNKKYSRNVACLTKEAIQLLLQYRWPGNVRELRNLIERLFAENQTEVIGLRSLSDWFQERQIAAQYARDKEYHDVIITPNTQPILLGHNSQNNDGCNSVSGIIMPSRGKNISKKALESFCKDFTTVARR